MPPRTIAGQIDANNPEKVKEALTSITGVIDDPIARVKITIAVVNGSEWDVTMQVVDRRNADYSPHQFLSQDKMRVGRWLIAWHVTDDDIDGDPQAVYPVYAKGTALDNNGTPSDAFYRAKTDGDGVIVFRLAKVTAPEIHAAVIGLSLVQKFDGATGLPLAVE